MDTLPGFYIYPSYTSISLQQFRKLLHFQLHFPNLNPVFLLVYFHESFHAVPSIPVVFQYSRILVLYSSNIMHHIPVCYSSNRFICFPVFQYCHPLLNSSIPLTVSPISIFLFWYPNVLFSQFLSCLFLCFSFRNFHCFIPVFQSLWIPCLFHVSPSFFLFPSFPFPCDVFEFFAAFPLCLMRHLRDGTRNPSIGRPPPVVLALLACRQFPVLPT